jgi:hypothetical protein
MDTPALRLVADHFGTFGQGYAQSFLNAVPEPTSSVSLIGALALLNGRRRKSQL